GCIWHGGFNIQNQIFLSGCLGSSRPKRRYSGVVLLEIGEILEKGLDTRGTKEGQDIIFYVLQVRQISSHCMIDDCLGKLYPVLCQIFRYIFLSYVRTREKVFFTFVLLEIIKKIRCGFYPNK